MPEKFLHLFQSLYHCSPARVRVFNELSPEFTSNSGVRQGCPASPFLFNIAMELIIEDALSHSNASGVKLHPGPNLTDIGYADDIALLSSDAANLQRLLDNLSVSAQKFGMRFAPEKCSHVAGLAQSASSVDHEWSTNGSDGSGGGRKRTKSFAGRTPPKDAKKGSTLSFSRLCMRVL